jgi:glycerophosphoryl diester phosphodiesterase
MTRLFAHRGFTGGKKNLENTVVSLKKAYGIGYRAIEFDIWLVDGEVLLNHNRPDSARLEKLPKLAEYFCFRNEMAYWLDFKNLELANADEFLSLVKQKIELERVDLKNIYFAPFITDYALAQKILEKVRKIFGADAQFVAVCSELKDAEKLAELKNFLTKNQVKYLSIFHQLVDENLLKTLAGVELFAWTVNDSARFKILKNLGIKNFATDKILLES